MTATAEEAQEALAALARDLVEEIAAGRALELAQSDPDALELAFVRPFQRTERVRGRPVQEQVRGYTENRLPGQGLDHPISEASWLKGERDWVAKGEAIWKKNQWKPHGNPKSADQIADEVQNRTFDKLPDNDTYRPAGQALDKATDHLLRRGEQAGQIDQNHLARAYHELGRAHRHITEKILPNAKPEEYPQIAEHLQRISGHMQDLDRAMGANPQATQKTLGSFEEVFAHAGQARREEEVAKRANYQPGDYVRQAATGRVGRVTDPAVGAGENRRWYVHFPGDRVNKLWPAGELRPASPQEAGRTGLEGQLQDAATQSWVGRRVKLNDTASPRAKMLSQGGEGIVVGIPERMFDSGSETFVKAPPGYVSVSWASDRPDYEPTPVPVSALIPAEMAPKTGAAAVHPHMGGHLTKLPGDTISGHAHAHVPKPLPVQAPDQRGLAVQAAQQVLAMRDAQDQMQLQDDMARAQAERTGIPLPGTYAPLTDDQYAAHVARTEHLIASELAAGHSTDKTETLDGRGQVWKPERAAVHNEIVKSYLDKAVSVPSEGKGLMMGGLGGAGKTTVLKQIPEIDLTRYAVVNPDDIKEELARRGMVPQVEGLSPMEASVLVHEESSHIANLVAQQLYARHKNIAWDITMSSGRSAARRIDQMEHHGYGEVQGVFVHIPVETSVERARARHRRGLEKYRQGNGSGGRLVPADLIRAAETKPGSTANREAFESLRNRFNAWQLWDNSGTKPVLVEKSKPAAGTGIMSVEDLMRQQEKTLSTEAAARAAEKGQPAPVG